MSTPAPPPGPNRVRVCLCDDAREFRLLLRTALAGDPDIEGSGEAAAGRVAAELIEREVPDVALLDMSMPGLDGLEVLARVRQRVPQTRVIVVSGFARESLKAAAMKLGADGYIHKPDVVRMLAAEIRRIAAEAGQARKG